MAITKMQKVGTEEELNNCWDLDYVTTCTIDDEEPNKCGSIIVLKYVQVEFKIIANPMKIFTLQLFSRPASRMSMELLPLLMFLYVAQFNVQRTL